MTTIAAVKKGKQIALSCDSLVTYSSSKEKAKYRVSKAKLFQFGENYLATTGSITWDTALKDYFSTLKTIPPLTSEVKVYRFIVTALKEVEENHYLNVGADEDSQFKDLKLWGILVNKNGIFGISCGVGITQYTRLFAEGGGQDFALGAMFALYDSDLSAKEIAEAGVKAGCEFNRDSELPLFTVVIDL